ncbi:MAG: hypothetical protein JSS02_20450 [Planctomycetes bacterium]|nr:hypothetical protein [Planctomycetota bacterium]
MLRVLLVLLATCGCLLADARAVLALEAVGTIKKIDPERRLIVVFAGGQDRHLTADRHLQVLDEAGRDLPEGLQASALKTGVTVTITVEREQNQFVLKKLQLGGTVPARPTRTADRRVTGERVGLKPLTEMSARDTYQGEDGGLYGQGENEPPPALRTAAREETAQIVPRGRDGRPARDGRIVLISISMSNWTQEFSVFKRLADRDPEKSPRVTIVDCAQGGQPMSRWADPQSQTWTVAEQRLAREQVTPAQVQVVWIKLANPGPSGDLAQHGKALQKDTTAVLQQARERFPNLRLAYLESRIFAGHATTGLNPEPYAYEGAFVVRWLIQAQQRGDRELNYKHGADAVKAPLLLWGTYLWGDGAEPRQSDGLVWNRDDFAADGTHPSEAGQRKVAELLLKFCKTDDQVKSWFVRQP